MNIQGIRRGKDIWNSTQEEKNIWIRKRGKRGGKKSNRHSNIRQEKNVDPALGVYNLTTKILEPDQIKVLQKGLKFAPTNQFNTFQAYNNTHKFIRKLSLKKLFSKNTNHKESNKSLEYIHTELKPKSTFNPTNANSHFINTKHLKIIKVILSTLKHLKI